jgi:hypothetical protein
VRELEQNDGGNADGRFLHGPGSTTITGAEETTGGWRQDRAYILGFFLVLGLGALLIVVAWR